MDSQDTAIFFALLAGAKLTNTHNAPIGHFTIRKENIFSQIVSVKKPAYLCLENVPGLLSHDAGRTVETILTALAELGYNLEWCVLNSKHHGVPQQRRRLYIIGYTRTDCAGQIFPLESRNGQNLKQLIGGCQGQRVYDPGGVASTQCSGSGGWGGKMGKAESGA